MSVPLPRPRAVGRALSIALLAALLGACASDGGDAAADDAASADAASDENAELSIAMASFDVAVGSDQRLLAGVFDSELQPLTFGEVEFQLGYLGEEAGGAVEITQRTAAPFLPVPGWEPEGDSEQPTFTAGGSSDGRGVYAAQVDLDQAGYWGLRVLAELDDGRELEGQTVFTVAEETQVPDVGDPAPATANHTSADVESGEVAPVALDSRAQDGAEVPDPHLHDATVEEAIEAGRPAVVIVSTPVYCRSNFCGPLVETLAASAERFEDRADFIHLEIYEDFEEQALNDAAAEWIQPADGSAGNEPWVFLVGADGHVEARWDNVLDLEELEGLLAELPVLDDTSSEADG